MAEIRSAHVDGAQAFLESRLSTFGCSIGFNRRSSGLIRTTETISLGADFHRPAGGGSGLGATTAAAVLAENGLGLQVRTQLIEQTKMAGGVVFARQRRVPGHTQSLF